MKPDFSEEAKDFISKLLEWDPNKWLGSGPKGCDNIKKHSFFADLDWDKLYKRELKAPYVPRVTS